MPRREAAERVSFPSKIHHLLYYVFRALDGELGTVEMMKIIFLIDAAYWRLFGRSLSGAEYSRGHYGPYSRAVMRAARDMYGHEITVQEQASPRRKRAHRVGDQPRFEPELSAVEAEVVRQVVRAVRSMGPKELEAHAYSLEPMRAVIESEGRLGRQLVGTPLDMGLLQQDAFMARWLANREAAAKLPPDPEYDEFAAREASEFQGIMSQG